MKKFENLGRSLSKDEQKNVRGGDGCIGEYGYQCCLDAQSFDDPCCAGLKCEINADHSGTICVPV